jgi:hypothetical protein
MYGEYLQEIGEKKTERHCRTREVASRYYNFNCFPFVLGANANTRYLGKGVVAVELAHSTNNEVIRNFKIYFANEFKGAVAESDDTRCCDNTICSPALQSALIWHTVLYCTE